jgi:flavin-dependent dehydrogenase
MVFLDEKLGVLGYGFTHSKGGSIGVMIDPSSTEEHRLRKLREIAKKMGASPESLKGVYEYSGELAQSDSIPEGNVFIIGDAARTTDPASGNGLNTGLRDARDLGQWIRDERRGIEGGMEKFLRNVTENTRYTFRGSVQFQRLPAWAKERLGAFSPLLRYSDGGALNAASVHAPKVVSKTAGKVLRWVGAQTGMPMSDHDPTQSLLIHGRLAETSCDRSFLSRTLDGLLRSAR